MAMNKKEQAEYNAALRAAVVGRALNWTQPVPLDVPAPNNGETRGFTINEYTKEVLHALSSCVSHSVGWEPPKRVDSQRAISMYSTKLLALKALRHAVEVKAANDLADIDEQIAAEMKASA